jgi:hypothetical protein
VRTHFPAQRLKQEKRKRQTHKDRTNGHKP